MTEIITAQEATNAELNAIAESINQTINLITMHEEAFEKSTLEPRLIIGMEIAKAQEAFGMLIPNPSGINQHTKELVSRRDTTPNPLGFSGWLTREIPLLKRPTALKYATAFKALGINHHASASQIKAKVADLRHAARRDSLPEPSLTALYKAAKPANPTKTTPLKTLPMPPGSENDENDIAEHDALQIIAALAKFLRNGSHQILTKSQALHLDQQLLAAREILRPLLK